jgi:nickel/cobalt transporter (NicO) family protein
MRHWPRWVTALALLAMATLGATSCRADTVASLLGNFTINQYCALRLGRDTIAVHYVVIYGQLPALRELHNADSDGDGVTSQSEREAYVAKLAPGMGEQLQLRLDGNPLPLRAAHWTSTLPTEQGGFSLRVDVDFSASVPAATGVARTLEFANQNYPGRMGWHEIVVESASGVSVFDTNAYSTSLTSALREALQSLPSSGPLDERSVHLRFTASAPPPGAVLLAPRPGGAARTGKMAADTAGGGDSAWLARATVKLVDMISAPRLGPRIALLALLGALLLGAVHALSPGHGKTLVGAYLIGSRGTPRHAAFLGFTVTLTHTAGVFLLGFATLYASRFIVPERLFPALSLISALLILGMGIVLLAQRGRAARRALALAPSRRLGHGLMLAHRHAHSGAFHSHGNTLHSHLPPGTGGERVSWRSLLALGVSGGLVPCPSALVLLLAAVTLNKTAYGMLLVLSFSVGLAITLTAVGVAFLCARNRFRQPSVGARWPHALPVLSAAAITVVGLGLCFSALRNFG